jgi:hypothetical protein
MRKLGEVSVKAATLATVILCSCLAPSIYGQSQERVRIIVFPYSSHESDKPEQPAEYLQSRISRLVEQIFYGNENLKALANLSVEPAGTAEKMPHNVRDRADFWKNTGVLEFLSGEVDRKIDPPVIVSDIYVGEDKGSLPSPLVTIRAEMTTTDYGLSHDLHCALTLYVLAMEADRLHADQGVVSQYLAEAKSVLGSPDTSKIHETERMLAQAVQEKLDLLKQIAGRQ